MIVDETMVYDLLYPFEFSPDGKGELETAKQLRFIPPTPRVDTTRLEQMMTRGLRSILLEKEALLTDEDRESARSESESLELGDNSLPPLHLRYKDEDDDEKRKELINQLEKDVTGQEGILGMSESIDLAVFAETFGRLMTTGTKKQCFVGNSDTNLNLSMWNDSVMPKDRVRAALKYCCFFVSMSSGVKATGSKPQ